MKMGRRPGESESADGFPSISAEERDALHSQAMTLLSGIGPRRASLDPQFSDDLRHLLETLGDIGEGGPIELAMPSAELRRVIGDPGAAARGPRISPTIAADQAGRADLRRHPRATRRRGGGSGP